MTQLKVNVNKLNRRRNPITDFSDKSNISGTVARGFLLVSKKEETNNLGTWYMDTDGYYYWGGGLTVISQYDPENKETSITNYALL